MPSSLSPKLNGGAMPNLFPLFSLPYNVPELIGPPQTTKPGATTMNAIFAPEQEMRASLRELQMSGTFEAHVTVELQRRGQEEFRRQCEGWGVKCVVIELPEGETKSQPMTASYHRGSLAEVVEQVAQLCEKMRQAGLVISRLKLEAVTNNAGVPDSNEQAAAFPDTNYFEFHVKLRLPPQTDLQAISQLCQQHDARLSSNALKQEQYGNTQRFVTMRRYGLGRAAACADFDRLLDDLQQQGYTATNQLREYTIFDSKVSLDAGWIDTPH